MALVQYRTQAENARQVADIHVRRHVEELEDSGLADVMRNLHPRAGARPKGDEWGGRLAGVDGFLLSLWQGILQVVQ